MEKTSSRVIEEVRVKWDSSALVAGHGTGYRLGVDQNGRTVEVNRSEGKDSTIHIDGVLRYSCWTKSFDPVSVLKKMRGMHSFVILEA